MSFAKRTKNGVAIVSEQTFVFETWGDLYRMSIEFVNSQEDFEPNFTHCTFEIGGQTRTEVFSNYMWGFKKATIFKKRIWTDLENGTPVPLGVFDTSRLMWIEYADGDPDTGYADNLVIEKIESDFDRHFEIFFPEFVTEKLYEGLPLSITLGSGDDSIVYDYVPQVKGLQDVSLESGN